MSLPVTELLAEGDCRPRKDLGDSVDADATVKEAIVKPIRQRLSNPDRGEVLVAGIHNEIVPGLHDDEWHYHQG
jgi:hypothetical protein